MSDRCPHCGHDTAKSMGRSGLMAAGPERVLSFLTALRLAAAYVAIFVLAMIALH